MENDSLKIELGQTPFSLKELAVQSIRRAIFEGKLEPEVIYSDVGLAKTLGISKTPVREALIDLASRELMVHEPRRGFMLRQLTETDVRNLFDYRETLEIAIVCRVVPNITSEGIRDLESILLEQKQPAHTRAQDLLSILADRRFHMRLAELCGNPFFLKAVEQVRDLCDLAGVSSLRSQGRRDEAVVEHEALLETIRKKSVDGAIEKMKSHLQSTCRRVLQNL